MLYLLLVLHQSQRQFNDVGIKDKDVLVVYRCLKPQKNKTALRFIDVEFSEKRINLEKNCII
jgi:DNA polymerase V